LGKGIDIAFGHTNTDLDCLGSLILVKNLFPTYKLLKSSRIHPSARHLYGFYSGYFNFISPQDISGKTIDNIIIVDTCVAARVNEYFSCIKNSSPAIRIFDHHLTDRCDILGAVLEGGNFGANTSLLGKIAMQKGISLESEEATIALTAIYADTGRLIYESVTRDDYEVSAWLLDMGASLRLVRSFLEAVRENEQVAVLEKIRPEIFSIQGNEILISYLELEENVPGLAAVVEKIMDMRNHDAYFAVFWIPREKTILLIGRSQLVDIDLHSLFSVYGGGGHQLAASARIINRDGLEFLEEFKSYLSRELKPATRAKDIMKKNVFTIHETTSLLDASMFLERVDYTAVPVVDRLGGVSGFISLRDIMKGRKLGKMHAPVKAFMSKPVISVGSMATMREMERLFCRDKIGHLLIMDDGKLLGIVTRWDYLQFQKRGMDGWD
jgi:tRNA nucleotidyltransferase (CCA-adding enzyme)